MASDRLPFEGAWQDYLAAEKTCVKPVWKEALERFLSVFNTSSVEERSQWAADLVTAAARAPGKIPMRRPLVERGLLPALLPGAERGDPAACKAVVGIVLENMGQASGQALSNLSVPGLSEFCGRFEEPYRMILYAWNCNPQDEDLRRWAIKWLCKSVWFVLHELPAGLLYDASRGATPAECIELELGEVALLERLATEDGSLETHRELIERARFHCTHYRAYLLAESRPENYEAYLEADPNLKDYKARGL